MPKPQNARIPADLREIKGMTLDEIERVNALRKTRSTLQTRLDNLPKKKQEYESEIDETAKVEADIIGAAKSRVVAVTQ